MGNLYKSYDRIKTYTRSRSFLKDLIDSDIAFGIGIKSLKYGLPFPRGEKMDYGALAKKCGLREGDLLRVEELLLSRGNFTPQRIRSEMRWFFDKLGIGGYYFQTTPIEVMAHHIESLRAAEIIAQNTQSPGVNVDIRSEREEGAFYLVNAAPEKTTEIELRIEHLFKDFRLQSYRTQGKAMKKCFLRLYFASKPLYKEKVEGTDDFTNNINQDFLETSSREAIIRYRRVYNESRNLLCPYVHISQKPQTCETRVMVSLSPYASERFLSRFSEVMTTHKLRTTRKYVEPMRDGRKIFSFYLPRIKNELLLEKLKEDISLISLAGKTPIDDVFIKGTLTAPEYIYAHCLCQFTHQFMTAYTAKTGTLEKALSNQPEMHGIVHFLKLRMIKDTYTENRIYEVVRCFPEIVKNLYTDFRRRFDPRKPSSLSRHPLEEVMKIMELHVSRETQKNIAHAFLGFNRSILKTNFYKKNKTTISFRMSPDVLDPGDYAEKPFGIFFILAKEMRGFHVRFRDIARGGIRIVGSRSPKEYDTNSDYIFEENYRLALTQHHKNKDIPEGGSKGTILLAPDFQDQPEIAFKKYIDGLLDVIQSGDPEVIDRYGKTEILFLGPDEGTAGFMDLAADYARKRRYPFWKSFTSGKSPELGGIPHDLYGMTTAGVYEYELQILKRLGIREEDATKIQTGGPDGDLGSNEIKVSKSKYTAIVDGSGVLYDTNGINRAEILRLAKARKPVREFRREKLSPKGFLVLVEDRSVKLFDGTIVANGTEFRNHFHLTPYARADLFVPCGGRPESINILNWKRLLDDKGVPAFKIMVEGANLFTTQDARIELEKKGVIIIKDASANKGGVTSSSLEVLASLALTPEEYEQLVCVHGIRIPAFRKAYIEEILKRIRYNVRREFELLWREHKERKIPFSLLSDSLSRKINRLRDAVYGSDLSNRQGLFEGVIKRHIPAILLRRLGMKEILERVPEAYLRAIFATTLARDFVYNYGLESLEVDFCRFVASLEKGKKP